MMPFKNYSQYAATKNVFCFIQVGALFVLPCTVSNILLPPPNQLSSRKWKEYVAKKPKTISGK